MGKPVGKQRPNFNPRSPRGERLDGSVTVLCAKGGFQSTLSARRATIEKKCDKIALF